MSMEEKARKIKIFLCVFGITIFMGFMAWMIREMIKIT